MSRPLMQSNIVQLEKMFAASKADEKILRGLEGELQFRKTPRAVGLLAEVQGVLCGKQERFPAPTQGILPFGEDPQPTSAPRVTPVVAKPQTVAPRKSPPSAIIQVQIQPTLTPTVTHSVVTTVPNMSVDDAYKALKATPSSTWEAIELTRRALVQQAHPDRVCALNPEKQIQAKADAKRANAAYAVLRVARGS